ncbi:uncharacterized protein [Venturia canescens]|uniref:uncharacterized protein n=1 Tax=Venturia canescens TaxID=32260 RepID=UPI001C9C8C36|nr:uncharacterized protein LOC122408482 [Venturia canescens]
MNNLSINVYSEKEEVILQVRVSKEKKEQHFSLLYIEDVSGCVIGHFAWIKNLSRLVNSQLNSDGHKKYICDRPGISLTRVHRFNSRGRHLWATHSGADQTGASGHTDCTEYGFMDSSQHSAGLVHHAAVDHGYQELQDLLTQFWVQEEVPGSGESHLTPDEQECETQFLTTHKRHSDGRYVVRLPVKSTSGTLGGFFQTACLHRLQCKLNRDSNYKGLYDTFLGEYELLGHMTRVAGNHAPLRPIYYLPHHGVLTTKLRIVFNGTCNTDSGISLNDILHTGAKLQRDISDVLLWVRRHRFVFATDIVKMFRQIRVHESDWDLQRILWVNKDGRVVPFHLTTVTYGTRSAPFLAGRALDQLVKDEGGKYPEAVVPFTKGRYVDDIYGGADQLADLITQAEQLIGICTAGCFPLAKWQSNHLKLLTAVGATSSTENARVFEECETKVLGLAWIPHTDVFKFTVHKYTAGEGITKRIILSEIAQLYDPLGFLSPVTIRAKVLLQRL